MSKRILVVDDEAQFTTLLRTRLERQGYQVDEAWSGAQAQEKIQNEAFDLILTDYFMPALKGDELCQMLKADEKLRNIPVIIITAFNNRTPESFKAVGAEDVIYKPIDYDDLADKLETILS